MENKNKPSEAEFNSEAFVLVSQADIKRIQGIATSNTRKRYRLCLHDTTEHLTQEMIICLKSGQYMRPHRHPAGCSESYSMLLGRMDVYLLDSTGDKVQKVELAPLSDLIPNPFTLRICQPLFHFVVPKSEFVVYHEVFTGPFRKELSVEFAEFSPKEDEYEKIDRFKARLEEI